jgi:hypothetical protein
LRGDYYSVDTDEDELSRGERIDGIVYRFKTFDDFRAFGWRLAWSRNVTTE